MHVHLEFQMWIRAFMHACLQMCVDGHQCLQMKMSGRAIELASAPSASWLWLLFASFAPLFVPTVSLSCASLSDGCCSCTITAQADLPIVHD